MRIVCIGGGPAGLTFALLMKKLDPGHDITLVERDRPYTCSSARSTAGSRRTSTSSTPRRRCSSSNVPNTCGGPTDSTSSTQNSPSRSASGCSRATFKAPA